VIHHPVILYQQPVTRITGWLVGLAEDKAIQRSDLLVSLASAGSLHFTGRPVPKDEARREALSAACLLLLDSTSGTQVPGKLFESIRIGRPIFAITARDSAMDRILRDSDIPCSYIYPDTPEEQIDRDLLALLRAPVTRSTPSDSLLRQFDGAAQARRYPKSSDACVPRTRITEALRIGRYLF